MWTPERIVLHPEASQFPLTQSICQRLSFVPVTQLDTDTQLAPYLTQKRTLILRPIKGDVLKPCPGTTAYRCCGYQILNTGLNCGFDCTYCILQDYLQVKAQTVFVDLPDHLEALKRRIMSEPDKLWRIGTGEFTDSLIHDSWTGLSGILVEWARSIPNMILELKTKSIHIDELLRLNPPKNIVLAWSLNTDKIAKDLEFGAPTIAARLKAARQVVDHGYKVAFHFDPIVPYEGFEADYQQVVTRLLDTIPPDQIRWISMGVLRFTKGLYEIFKHRSPSYLEEMIVAPDQKWRYPRPVRIRAYQAVYNVIRHRAPQVYTYLCMESPAVWRAVMGADPGDNDQFAATFDKLVGG